MSELANFAQGVASAPKPFPLWAIAASRAQGASPLGGVSAGESPHWGFSRFATFAPLSPGAARVGDLP
jgi:hypothetical protein